MTNASPSLQRGQADNDQHTSWLVVLGIVLIAIFFLTALGLLIADSLGLLPNFNSQRTAAMLSILAGMSIGIGTGFVGGISRLEARLNFKFADLLLRILKISDHPGGNQGSSDSRVNVDLVGSTVIIIVVSSLFYFLLLPEGQTQQEIRNAEEEQRWLETTHTISQWKTYCENMMDNNLSDLVRVDNRRLLENSLIGASQLFTGYHPEYKIFRDMRAADAYTCLMKARVLGIAEEGTADWGADGASFAEKAIKSIGDFNAIKDEIAATGPTQSQLVRNFLDYISKERVIETAHFYLAIANAYIWNYTQNQIALIESLQALDCAVQSGFFNQSALEKDPILVKVMGLYKSSKKEGFTC